MSEMMDMLITLNWSPYIICIKISLGTPWICTIIICQLKKIWLIFSCYSPSCPGYHLSICLKSHWVGSIGTLLMEAGAYRGWSGEGVRMWAIAFQKSVLWSWGWKDEVRITLCLHEWIHIYALIGKGLNHSIFYSLWIDFAFQSLESRSGRNQNAFFLQGQGSSWEGGSAFTFPGRPWAATLLSQETFLRLSSIPWIKHWRSSA